MLQYYMCITQDMYMNIYFNKSKPQVQHLLVPQVNHQAQALPKKKSWVLNHDI